MPDPIRLDTQPGYDLWSQIYDDEDNALILLEEPVVHAWLSDVAGLRVADVGCGTGRHTAWLTAAGARVDAFDCSPGMLARARAKTPADRVTFHEHMFPRPLPARDSAFDVTLLALVADHLADLPAAFRELHRVTRPGGRVIFTVLHPAMNLLGLTARFTDPDSGKEVRVAAFEHTFGDYVMAALGSGLTLEEITERKADADLVKKTPRAEKYLNWPMLLALRLRKA